MSDGRAMDVGWYGELDVAGAVTFLAQQRDVDPGRIAVVGMSTGGEEAIGAVGTDQRIAAVVAEGATAPSLAAAAAAAAPRPILLIAASEVADEPDAAEHIAATAVGNVDVWVVDAAGHTDGLRTAPAEWERRVIEFLDSALT